VSLTANPVWVCVCAVFQRWLFRTFMQFLTVLGLGYFFYLGVCFVVSYYRWRRFFN